MRAEMSEAEQRYSAASLYRFAAANDNCDSHQVFRWHRWHASCECSVSAPVQPARKLCGRGA